MRDSETANHSMPVSMQHTAGAAHQEVGRWVNFPTPQQLERRKRRPGSKRRRNRRRPPGARRCDRPALRTPGPELDYDKTGGVQLVTLKPVRESPRLHTHAATYFDHFHAISDESSDITTSFGYPYILRCNAQSESRQMVIFQSFIGLASLSLPASRIGDHAALKCCPDCVRPSMHAKGGINGHRVLSHR